jgi:hypothetical protein
MPDPVDQIRSGKGRLAARGTARIEVTHRFTDFDEEHESRVDGIIDFEQGRYRTRRDNEEHIGIGGMGFTRTDRDERWIVQGNDPAAAPGLAMSCGCWTCSRVSSARKSSTHRSRTGLRTRASSTY